jgi:N-acetylglucosaminyldiphosphoundecaprenol N-acetyl-beta-D-mannosaminyltransferase
MGQRLNLLGVQFEVYNQSQLFSIITDCIKKEKKLLIGSGNVHAFNLAYKERYFWEFFNRLELIRIDGAGVRLAGRILGHELPPRMTWADFAWDLAEYCSRQQHSIFFLGAKEGVAVEAADRLRERYPCRIVGTHHGYFDKTPGSAENNAVISEINALKPDILVVGFGMPLQERWLMENWDSLDVNVALTGGAVFDYISGNLTRAPRWMTDNGLEWLGRLMIEPRRLWRRYIIGNPLFISRVVRQRLGMLNLRNGQFTKD